MSGLFVVSVILYGDNLDYRKQIEDTEQNYRDYVREADRADPVLAAFQRYATVPVLNLESARWHPLQGLADTATWMAHLGPDLRGQPLTLSWAPHPRALPTAVPNQVLLSAALMGMQVTVAHPQGMDLDPQVMARATSLATAGGGGVRVVHDPDEGALGARGPVAGPKSVFSPRVGHSGRYRAQIGPRWAGGAGARTEGRWFSAGPGRGRLPFGSVWGRNLCGWVSSGRKTGFPCGVGQRGSDGGVARGPRA